MAINGHMKVVNNLSYQIRQMSQSDLPSVYKLVQNTLQVSYRAVYPAEAIDFFKNYHQKEIILKESLSGYTIVVETAEAIIATGTLLDTNITRVFVHPNFQRKGIGKLVAMDLIRKAERGAVTILELDASLVSTKFWESMGFIIARANFIPLKNNKKLIYYEMSKKLRYNL